jgi:hypothetical protein
VEWSNDLNRYPLYFPEEFPKPLDQHEINEILDQAKAVDPEWYETMVDSNIDVFEMPYEESVCYFKHSKNLEKIRCTNCPGLAMIPLNNMKSVTNSIGKFSKNSKSSSMWYHY